MHLTFITAAALTMGFAGVYMNWLTDHFTHKSLGAHRAVLVVLPVFAACLMAFGNPDQAALIAWGFAIWAVVTWAVGCIYFYARRAVAGVAHTRTVCTINAWLGVGLAAGGAACLGLALGVLN